MVGSMVVCVCVWLGGRGGSPSLPPFSSPSHPSTSLLPVIASPPPPPDKAVFPKLDVIGWYALGGKLEPLHMQLHKQVGAAGCERGGAMGHSWSRWTRNCTSIYGCV